MNSLPLPSAPQRATLLRETFAILVLAAFAFAQPIFDLLGRTPQFLVIRRIQGIDLAALLLLVGLLVPLLFAVLNLMARRLPFRAYLTLHAALITALVTLIALPPIKSLKAIPDHLQLPLAISLGLIFCFIYLRWSAPRLFLQFLSPAILVFPAIFLLNPAISRLIFSASTEVPIGTQKNTTDTSVVMVIFDELPFVSLLKGDGTIDSERYPAFSRLASRSHIFTNATSPSAWTEHAVPAILTGNYPRTDRNEMPSADDHPQNLFTLLSGTHKLNVYEQVTHLCPDTLCDATRQRMPFRGRMRTLSADLSLAYLHTVLPNQYTAKLPDISKNWGNFFEDQAKRTHLRLNKKGLAVKDDWSNDEWLFRKFIDSITPTTEPTLDFLHVTYPHVPYRYLPSGKRYAQREDKNNSRGYRREWDKDEWPSIQQYQQHLLQLKFGDVLLGRLLDKLESTGRLENSIVVVTADHGTSFQPEQFSRRVSEQNFADIMLVPLFIKLPEQNNAEQSSRNVSTIDILPTITESLGLGLPEHIDGNSLFSNAKEREDKLFYELIDEKHTRKSLPAKADGGATIQRQERLFGNGDISKIYAIGPHSELHGETVKSLVDAGELSPLKADFENSDDYRNVIMGERYIPALVSGHSSADRSSSASVQIAVALNGVIQATTFGYPGKKPNEIRFSAMVPESAFKAGANDVAAFIIRDR